MAASAKQYKRPINVVTVNERKGSDIASASTINLDNATGNIVDVTGTTTITAVTLTSGRRRLVRFTDALTLTHGASLVLPSAANITTAAGDWAEFFADGSTIRCTRYTKADGTAIVSGSSVVSSLTKSITQSSHGFSAGDAIAVNSSGTYIKAKADDPTTAEFVGICTAVADSNNFTLSLAGSYVTGLSGLAAGSVYFLSASTAGALTTTAPTTSGYVNIPIFLAVSTSAGFVLNKRGIVNGDPVQGAYVQRSYNSSVSVTTDSTHIPQDDTKPQSNEGTEVFTVSHTPKASTNVLYITIMLMVSGNSISGSTITGALFQDSGADSIAAQAVTCGNNSLQVLTFRYKMIAGSTSQTTFKVRFGSDVYTATLNGVNGSRKYGGVAVSSILVEEFTS